MLTPIACFFRVHKNPIYIADKDKLRRELRMKFEQSQLDKILALSEEKDSYAKEILNLQNELLKLNSELDKKNTETNDIINKQDYLVSENIILTQKYEELVSQNIILKNELQETSSKLIETNEHVAKLTSSINHFESECESLKKQNSSLLLELSNLQANMVSKDVISDYEQKIAKANSQDVLLQAKLEELKEKLITAEEQLAECTANFEKTLAICRQQLLEEQCSHEESEKQWRIKFENLQQNHLNSQKQMENSLQSSITQLQDQLKNLNNEKLETIEETKYLKARELDLVQSMEKKGNEWQLTLQELKQRYKKKFTELQAIHEKNLAQLASSNLLIEEKTKQLSSVQNDLFQSQKDFNCISEKFDCAMKELENTNLQVKTITEKYLALHESYEKLNKEKDESCEKLNDALQFISKQEAELLENHKNLSLLKQFLEECNSEKKNLQNLLDVECKKSENVMLQLIRFEKTIKNLKLILKSVQKGDCNFSQQKNALLQELVKIIDLGSKAEFDENSIPNECYVNKLTHSFEENDIVEDNKMVEALNRLFSEINNVESNACENNLESNAKYKNSLSENNVMQVQNSSENSSIQKNDIALLNNEIEELRLEAETKMQILADKEATISVLQETIEKQNCNIIDLRKKLEDDLKSLELENGKKMSELKKKAEAKLAQMKNQLAEIREMSDKEGKQQILILEEKISHLTNEMAGLKERNEQYVKDNESYEAQCKELMQKIVQLEEREKELVKSVESCLLDVNNITKSKTALEEKIDELRVSLKNEANNKLEEEINRLKNEYEEKIEDMENAHAMKLKQVLRECSININEKEKEFQNAFGDALGKFLIFSVNFKYFIKFIELYVKNFITFKFH